MRNLLKNGLFFVLMAVCQYGYAQTADDFIVAAKQGDANAQYGLGWCYETGKGVTKDYSQAVFWHKKAAEQGNANAQYSLGLIYYNQGVEAEGMSDDKLYNEAKQQSGFFFREAIPYLEKTYQLNSGDNSTAAAFALRNIYYRLNDSEAFEKWDKIYLRIDETAQQKKDELKANLIKKEMEEAEQKQKQKELEAKWKADRLNRVKGLIAGDRIKGTLEVRNIGNLTYEHAIIVGEVINWNENKTRLYIRLVKTHTVFADYKCRGGGCVAEWDYVTYKEEKIEVNEYRGDKHIWISPIGSDEFEWDAQ
jgi:hypothetical protein